MISQHNIHISLCFRVKRKNELFLFWQKQEARGLISHYFLLVCGCFRCYTCLVLSSLSMITEEMMTQKRWFKDREVTWTKLRIYSKIFVCMMINRMRSSHGLTTSADEEGKRLVFWYQWLQGLYIQGMMMIMMMTMRMRDLYFFWLLSVASNVIFLFIIIIDSRSNRM